MQLLTFAVGELDFALEMPQVIEVTRVPPTRRRRAHGAESLDLRGTQLPLVALWKTFCLPWRRGAGEAIVIVQTARQTVALGVDQVRHVRTVPSDAVCSAEAPPGLALYVCGSVEIDGRHHHILDVDRVTDSPLDDLPGLQAAANHVQRRLRSALHRD